MTWRNVLGGLAFILSCPPMLGAMSLDLLATLFGGAVAILPMIAHDILHVGPWGVGILRSAPAVGGLCSAAFLARRPLRHSAGIVMFCGFAAYGVMTLLFGLSSSFLLSVGLLLFVGMADTLTGVIRQSIIQLGTPDEYRGRVMAVHSLCVGTAGQLGGFESGVTAAWFGAQGSILFGAAAVFVIVGLWAYLFPALRTIERPEQLQPAEAAA
jgi:sugar phosphate permease